MSDLEHDIISEAQVLTREVEWLNDVAERALRAAIDAQELAIGRHDGWMDSAFDASRTATRRTKPRDVRIPLAVEPPSPPTASADRSRGQSLCV